MADLTPIKRINIYEQDLTTAYRAEDSLDVVYVPGLYGISSIATEPDIVPPQGASQAGFDRLWEVGNYFYNTADKRAWVCTNVEERQGIDSETGEDRTYYVFSWAELTKDAYIEPSIDPAEFVGGDEDPITMLPPELFIDPEKLVNKYGVSYNNSIIGSGSDNHSHVLGSSVEYAVGIITAGLPVVYHCGVKFKEMDYIYFDIDSSNSDEEGTTEETETTEENETESCSFYLMSATADNLFDLMNSDPLTKKSIFREVLDVNEFDIKFITTGAHAPVIVSQDEETGECTFTFAENVVLNMIDVASTRGDALAMVDGWDEQSVNPDNNSLYDVLHESGPWVNGTYAAAFAPWAHYSTTTSTDVLLPPSYGYLCAYANSIKTNGSALAIAGVTRGLVPKLKSLSLQPTERLSNAIADSWQAKDDVANVNGITYIRNYGYCLWGNRTLHDNAETKGLVDTSFLSIRVMLCDLKKRLRNVAIRLLFEQNNDVLWGNFLFGVVPILERLKGIAAISNYKIIHIPTDDKTKLKAVIRLVTVKPLEEIEIGIVMVDDDVEVV